MSGIALFTSSTNCFDDAAAPTRISAFTCSVFHRSMKLSSWDCAVVVSVPVIVSTASTPLLHARSPAAWGATTDLTRGVASVSVSTATFFPSRMWCDFTSDITTFSCRSAVMSGVMRSARWRLADHLLGEAVGDERRLVLLGDAQLRVAADGSYMLPITANTWSSSVNDVHAASAAAELTGQIYL